MDDGLGFKELESFNLALLAKHWWRLIHNEQSLSFKILQSKYFPNQDPMQVMKDSRGSYLWHSLLEGRKVVEKRAFWKVGDGYRIDAWRDAWLNKSPSFKPSPPDLIEPTALRVANLIDQDRRIWKHDMIREIFTETDGTNISSIHLSREKIPNKLIWRSLTIGEFTVRSAYYVADKYLQRRFLMLPRGIRYRGFYGQQMLAQRLNSLPGD